MHFAHVMVYFHLKTLLALNYYINIAIKLSEYLGLFY